MEENVWPTTPVYPYLKDDYVLISLYVDDKKALPEEEQIEITDAAGRTKKLRTYGNKWEYVETKFFNTNAQPYYALVAPDGKLLNIPVPYTPNPDEYANFLECGLKAFEEQKELLGSK